MPTDNKPYKEVTLYNFATLRNAEYTNLENLKDDPSFIIFNLQEFSIKITECEYKLIDLGDFDPTTFLDFEHLRIQNPSHFCEELQIKVNELYNKIWYYSKQKLDDFYHINKLLVEYDEIFNRKFHHIKDNILRNDAIKFAKKEFKLKVWNAYVANFKTKNDFKQKEIGHNLLKFFHIKKHRDLIDDETKKEKKENFDTLINARIIIPEELFPKSETFFYGNTNKNKQYNCKQTPFFKGQHLIKINDVRKKKTDAITNESLKQHALEELNEENKRLSQIYHKSKQDSFNINHLNSLPYIISLEKIDNQFILLLDFDERYKNESDLQVEIGELTYLEKTINSVNKETDLFYYNFDLSFDLSEHFVNSTSLSANLIEGFKITVTFHSGQVKIFAFNLNRIETEIVKYRAEGCIELAETDEYGLAYPPSGHGIKMLGIADYRKVVSTISRYVPAEVAHIENLMASEYREKVTTKETSTEITDFTSTELDNEKTKETTTIDRFQMQNEVASIVNEQRNNNTTFNAGYSGGGYFANVTTGNSTVNSKQTSDKQAVENAKEITNKAVEKIVSKVKNERTVKVTEKLIDVNKYGFDNRGNTEHVSGVYRHINAVYRNRIHNYGKRLAYEFSIPEPALLHFLTIDNSKLIKELKAIEKPIDFHKRITSEVDLNKDNYLEFIKNYEIKSSEYSVFPDNIIEPKEIKKNDTLLSVFSKADYEINNFIYEGSYVRRIGLGTDGNDVRYDEDTLFQILLNGNSLHNDVSQTRLPNINTNWNHNPEVLIKEKSTNFSVGIMDLVLEIREKTISFNLKCTVEYSPQKRIILNWQVSMYNLLKSKYELLLNEYENSLKDKISEHLIDEKSKLESLEKSKQTAVKRQIEISSLKRNSLSYLISGESNQQSRVFGLDMYEQNKRIDFTDIKIKRTKQLDEYTAFVRFLEQAFEWDNMSYSFYPYYWAYKDTWLNHYNQHDDDALHQSFLQAGMARVIVTVRPGFEEAVNLYMVTGKIWNGGTMPVYGSSLFVSINNELNNNLESVVEDEWESVLPTNLIALQSSGVAIQQSGLPDLEKQDNLGVVAPNSNKLPTNKRKKFLGIF